MPADFIAALEYKSGRRIYCGARPEIGDFHTRERQAQRYNTAQQATDALETLVTFFKVRDRSAIKLIAVELNPDKRLHAKTSIETEP